MNSADFAVRLTVTLTSAPLRSVFLLVACLTPDNAHMGQFPQDGKNDQNVAFFFFFWSFVVTKRFDFFNFSQLFCIHFARPEEIDPYVF